MPNSATTSKVLTLFKYGIASSDPLLCIGCLLLAACCVTIVRCDSFSCGGQPTQDVFDTKKTVRNMTRNNVKNQSRGQNKQEKGDQRP